MQSFTIVVLFAVLATALAKITKEEAIEILEKCKKETGAKEDVKEMVEKQSLPSSQEGKCMLVCALRAKGLMDGDNINRDEMSKKAEEYYGNDPEKLDAAAEVMGKCMTLDFSGMDVCNKIHKMASCAKEHDFHL